MTHSFTTPGHYTVTLTATDDETSTCTATAQIVIDNGDLLPQSPALWMTPDLLAVAVGTPLDFTAELSDDQFTPITHTWDFGDGAASSLITPTHAYSAPGRYPVSLTVSDDQGNQSTATAAVYVFALPAQAAAFAAPTGFCPPAAPPPGAVIVNGLPNPPPPAGNNGRDGADRVFRVRGHVIFPAISGAATAKMAGIGQATATCALAMAVMGARGATAIHPAAAARAAPAQMSPTAMRVQMAI